MTLKYMTIQCRKCQLEWKYQFSLENHLAIVEMKLWNNRVVKDHVFIVHFKTTNYVLGICSVYHNFYICKCEKQTLSNAFEHLFTYFFQYS